MQKKLLSLLVLLMTAATGAWATVLAGGWCGDEVTYSLTTDGVMTISKNNGSGAMPDRSYDTQPWKNYREKVTDVVIEAGVTRIGNYLFYGLTNLKTVSLPEGLLTIGDMAFRECSSLGSITIPASVTSIGQYAFAFCSNLATVTFFAGSHLTTIDCDAFHGCSSLTSITIPHGVTSIKNYAFYECSELSSVSIPASVTTIGVNAFESCKKLTTVTFSEGSLLTSIGGSAFGHTALSSIDIPDGVTSIGESAFSYFLDAGFAEITIPASVTTIGNYAFYASKKLTTVTFSAGSHLTSIGDHAFDGCTNLATVTFNSNPSIGTGAFPNGATVTMNPTANEAGGAKWTTFYNQNYSFAADANTEVFKVALSGTELTLNKVANGIVDAGTAVVLKTTGDNPVMTKTTTASGDEQANDLTGVSAAAGVENDGTFYVLNNGSQGVGFYKLKSGKTVGVGKAYLTYTAGAREFFAFNEATGINSATLTNSEKVNNEVYDLQGRRVVNPTKGLYIVRSAEGRLQGKNGKKVFINK